MAQKRYTEDFKKQVLEECRQIGNASLVARSMAERQLSAGDNRKPVLRTDNGPQFIAHAFAGTCEELGITHERIPVKTPNMNAYIEAVHAILEEECYGLNDFESFSTYIP